MPFDGGDERRQVLEFAYDEPVLVERLPECLPSPLAADETELLIAGLAAELGQRQRLTQGQRRQPGVQAVRLLALNIRIKGDGAGHRVADDGEKGRLKHHDRPRQRVEANVTAEYPAVPQHSGGQPVEAADVTD